jgi:hypothetical protein
LEPFEVTHSAEFTMQPAGASTNVTWTMRGKMMFMSKVMCVFMDMDKMVGKDFEAGLAALEAAATEQPASAAK